MRSPGKTGPRVRIPHPPPKLKIGIGSRNGVAPQARHKRIPAKNKKKRKGKQKGGPPAGPNTNAFPPKIPESKRFFHAPRGSKKTVRSLIWKFEPAFLYKLSFSSFVLSFANS